jgi:MarR family transcriptional regulator for hemolysin
VVRLLDELQAAGLIERREGEDRRAKLIHVTAAGRAVAATVEQQSRRVRERLLAGIEPADLASAVRVLEQVLATLATLESPARDATAEAC